MKYSVFECVLKSIILFAAVAYCQVGLAECLQDKPESFDEFLPRFSHEKPFAIERTKLPLKVVKWREAVDIDGRRITDPQKFDLSLSEYWRWPTLDEYILENHLESEISPHSVVKVRLDLFKAEYPFKVSYVFGSHEGCWVLEQYEAKPI